MYHAESYEMYTLCGQNCVLQFYVEVCIDFWEKYIGFSFWINIFSLEFNYSYP